MLKKHSLRKTSFKFLRTAVCGFVLLLLSFSIISVALPQTTFADATPQTYTSPKTFSATYGFIFIDKDTILLTGEGPRSPKEIDFKKVTPAGNNNDKYYYYEATLTFFGTEGPEGDVTRSTFISIEKSALDAAFTNKSPVPIADIVYSTTANDDGTNENSQVFTGINKDQPVGFVFLSDTLTNMDSVKELTSAPDEDADPAFTPDLECDTTFTDPLSYVMCPLIMAATSAVDQLDKAITNQMTIDTNLYLGNNTTGDTFYNAWSSFRYIALALLVVVALVMILSEALSLDIFDAYSIRKILPRLLIAVIVITLSWSLMKFAIDLSNDVGHGIRALIYAPFSQMKNPELNPGGSSIAFGGIAIGLVSLGVLGVLSFAITALLAVLIAFGVLVLREMLILMLIIMAPIAIVAYILPNTQKAWKIWWDFFSKALLAFPIIVAFIATGRVFSKVVYNSSPEPGLLESAIAFGAYFLPYFMIPTAFKLAGGAIATISGMANDKSKGLFDRTSKFRQKKMAENAQGLKTGSRFNERGRFNVGKRTFNPIGRFNRLTQGASTGFSGGFGLGQRGAGAMDMGLRAASAEAMKNPMMQQLAFNDDAILAMGLSAGSSAFAKQQLSKIWKTEDGRVDTARIDKAVSQAAAVGFNRENALAGMDLAARNKFFSLPGGDNGMNALLSTADAMAGVRRDRSGNVIAGNATMAENIMGGIEYQARGAGRFDIGHHDYKGWKPKMEGAKGAWGKAGLGQHAQGTSASLDAFGTSFQKQFAGSRSKESAVALMEMRSMLPNATSANQDIINKVLSSSDVGIDMASGVPIEVQLASKMTGSAASMDAAGRLIADDATKALAQQIRNEARVYDSGVPIGARGMDPGAMGAGGGDEH